MRRTPRSTVYPWKEPRKLKQRTMTGAPFLYKNTSDAPPARAVVGGFRQSVSSQARKSSKIVKEKRRPNSTAFDLD